MPLLRVRTAWTGSAFNGPSVSTHYFDSSVGTAAQAVTAVADFWDACLPYVCGGNTFATEPEVAAVNEANGKVLDVFSVGAQSGAGTAGGTILPPATQGLLRINTGEFVNGRQVKGHLFIGAPSESHNGATGTPDSSYTAGIKAAADALIADAVTTWVVWSRKNGSFFPVSNTAVANEWAVLTSRRD